MYFNIPALVLAYPYLHTLSAIRTLIKPSIKMFIKPDFNCILTYNTERIILIDLVFTKVKVM